MVTGSAVDYEENTSDVFIMSVFRQDGYHDWQNLPKDVDPFSSVKDIDGMIDTVPNTGNEGGGDGDNTTVIVVAVVVPVVLIILVLVYTLMTRHEGTTKSHDGALRGSNGSIPHPTEVSQDVPQSSGEGVAEDKGGLV